MLLYVLRFLPFVEQFVGEWRCARPKLENDPAVLCPELRKTLRSPVNEVRSGLPERDYATQLGDETFLPDVRLALQTHDGHILLAHQMGRLSPFYTRGQQPGTWRIAPTFESASGEYAWLNEGLAIGIGRWLISDEIEYNVYVVL